MYRVCLLKSTGELIEMQSGGKIGDLEVLKSNAIKLGYKEKDIELKYVPDEEWNIINENLNKSEKDKSSVLGSDKNLLNLTSTLLDEINILREAIKLPKKTIEEISTSMDSKNKRLKVILCT